MSSQYFKVVQHQIEASHIREYPDCTALSQEDVLKLHVKQYMPLQPVHPHALTIIATHALGFPKELYEPLWDQLYLRSGDISFHIRSIWIADIVNMGYSGELNEKRLGNEVSWTDHARDLLCMVNHFRQEMPRPIFGLGHSFGGCIITNLAYLHPRLLSGMILLDPVIQLSPPMMGLENDPPSFPNVALYRRDVWPSRESAVEEYSQLTQSFDSRCRALFNLHAFRDLPTAIYGDDVCSKETIPVTTRTTKLQEFVTQLRTGASKISADGSVRVNRETHADMDPSLVHSPFYRSEPRLTFFRLPELRPPALWLLAERAPLLAQDETRKGIQICGTGVGGSGGVAENRIKEIILPKQGHFFPFETVNLTADHCSTWLEDQIRIYQENEFWREKKRETMDPQAYLVINESWKQILKPPTIPSRKAKKLPKL